MMTLRWTRFEQIANTYPIFGLTDTVKSDPIVVCPVHDLWLCDCGLYANPGSNP